MSPEQATGASVDFRSDQPSFGSIHRIALSSGAREPWKQIEPVDPVGLYGVARVFLSADGQSFVYAYVRFLDQLYPADGLH